VAIERVHIEQFLELAKHHPVIDVRSPGEYKHAHMPGAHPMPLFTDEERKIVGTTYKQESREQAIKIGLHFFGPKMRGMVEQAEQIAQGIENWEPGDSPSSAAATNVKSPIPNSKILLVYCWRGGMRSGAVSWLLDMYGFKVYTLIGGYKNFRRYVLDTFKLPFPFRVIGGYTGSGKTEVLKALREKNERVIDLEDIAKHKGSAFGNIGMPQQPGQEMFENLLAIELRKMTDDGWQMTEPNHHPSSIITSSSAIRHLPPAIWIEDESQRIGLVNLPNDLWATMRQSPLHFLEIPFEERLRHLVEEYGNLDRERMIDAIGRIREKLGGLNAQNAVSLLQEGNTFESFRILLKYYDKFYLKALHNRGSVDSLLHSVDCKSVSAENANRLIAEPQYHHENP
jgi:tRNA 2-selenouridine synthase